ncbi:hypothetical protein An06g02410 [Aspergillus niger]|uniref:Uncharacterized protein n=2 Tax=Aspergillus niger TaxID=5061 RepID=A2QLU0_ASPNC|nr:hypothetical protein An06g02410 [Aspergillus niger]CAK39209.1 hypothetical protein An06g02410 [Aspergillus niger]
MEEESIFRNLGPAYANWMTGYVRSDLLNTDKAAFTVLDDMRDLRSSYWIPQERGAAGEAECSPGKRGRETGSICSDAVDVALAGGLIFSNQ